MKNFVIIICSFVYTTIIGCGQQQNKTSKDTAENMLMEFYTKHFKILEIPSINYEIRDKQLDSLIQKHCTQELIKEAKNASFNSGVDILTYDLGSVELNENLKIRKDAANENRYIVSFIATYKDVPGGPIKEQVVLDVTVVKEGKDYKIASVVGSAR